MKNYGNSFGEYKKKKHREQKKKARKMKGIFSRHQKNTQKNINNRKK